MVSSVNYKIRGCHSILPSLKGPTTSPLSSALEIILVSRSIVITNKNGERGSPWRISLEAPSLPLPFSLTSTATLTG